MQLPLRRRPNKFQPHSVNPRRGSVSLRRPSRRDQSWWGRHKVGILSFTALTLALIAIGAGYYFSQHWLVVRQIEITTLAVDKTHSFNADKLHQQVQPIQGQSLLWLDTAQLQQQVQRSHPALREVYITKHYPQTLQINYVVRHEVAQIHSHKQNFLVDRSGFVFAEGQNSHVPQIQADETPITVNSHLSAQGVGLALYLINNLRFENATLNQVSLKGYYLEVKFNKPPTILVGFEQDTDQLVPIISDLLQQAKKSHGSVKEIDLRFNRPVLRS